MTTVLHPADPIGHQGLTVPGVAGGTRGTRSAERGIETGTGTSSRARVTTRSAFPVLVLFLAASCGEPVAPAPKPSDPVVRPPFGGTIFIDPDIITPDDPTTFSGLTYAGQAPRRMFDRRVNDWVVYDAFLYQATFDDGLTAEVQVNPEFVDTALTRVYAEFYARAIGQIPTALRVDMETVWIHRGVEPFGGGNRNILIHVGQGDLYIRDGILEETLVHEGAHTSLDSAHARSDGWLAAQREDPTFISTYARDHPFREDIAESFVPYLAVRYRADRISAGLLDTIMRTIPARIAYFDSLDLDMYPIN